MNNLENIFFQENCPSWPNIHFRWGFQLFWTAFDMLVTVVPLKVALGLENIDFWEFQKNNHASVTKWVFYLIFNAQKSIFSNPKATLNGMAGMGISKAS